MSDELADALRGLLQATQARPSDNKAVRDAWVIARGLLTTEAGAARPDLTLRQRELLKWIWHPGWFWFVESPRAAEELLLAVLEEKPEAESAQPHRRGGRSPDPKTTAVMNLVGDSLTAGMPWDEIYDRVERETGMKYSRDSESLQRMYRGRKSAGPNRT